jgi:RNA polymerase subunit RPABC4/transcription elongation factor Spt4
MAEPEAAEPCNLVGMSGYEREDEAEAGDDPEDPDEADMDEHDEPDLLPCPHCRKMITEDAERCHHCGNWVEPGTTVERSWATIIIVALIIFSMVGFAVAWVLTR